MQREPAFSQTPDDDSWEKLAEDLFGIDFGKAPGTEPFSAEDLSTDDLFAPAPSPAAETPTAKSARSQPEPIAPAKPAAPVPPPAPAKPPAKTESAPKPPDRPSPKPAAAKSSPGPSKPGSKISEGGADDETYWDVLKEWEWDEVQNGAESEAAEPAPKAERPQPAQPTRAAAGEQRDRPRRGRDRQDPQNREEPRRSERPTRSEEPETKPAARPARETPRPVRHEAAADDDFGAGLLDELETPREEKSYQPAARTRDEPRATTSPAEKHEDEEPRPQKRRRRRRRRGEEEGQAARPRHRNEAEEDEGFTSDSDEFGGDLLEAESAFEPQSESVEREEEGETGRARPPRRRRRRTRRGRDEAAPATERAGKPAPPVDEAEEDFDTVDDIHTSDEDEEFEGSSVEGAGWGSDDDDESTPDSEASYRNLPTWEEAISYLLKPHVSDPRSREADASGSRPRSEGSRSSERRGRRRR